MAPEPILLTPGPLTTQLRTRQAMLRDWGSRDPGFIALTAELRQRLLDVWPGLMLRHYGSDAACADAFGKERQTATNWRSGHCGPDAGSVSIAFLRWPDEMARLLGGA